MLEFVFYRKILEIKEWYKYYNRNLIFHINKIFKNLYKTLYNDLYKADTKQILANINITKVNKKKVNKNATVKYFKTELVKRSRSYMTWANLGEPWRELPNEKNTSEWFSFYSKGFLENFFKFSISFK